MDKGALLGDGSVVECWQTRLFCDGIGFHVDTEALCQVSFPAQLTDGLLRELPACPSRWTVMQVKADST